MPLPQTPAPPPKVVIDEGAVTIFVQLLASPSDDVREQVRPLAGAVAPGSCSNALRRA
jgi:hypothetical protein